LTSPRVTVPKARSPIVICGTTAFWCYLKMNVAAVTKKWGRSGSGGKAGQGSTNWGWNDVYDEAVLCLTRRGVTVFASGHRYFGMIESLPWITSNELKVGQSMWVKGWVMSCKRL